MDKTLTTEPKRCCSGMDDFGSCLCSLPVKTSQTRSPQSSLTVDNYGSVVEHGEES